MNAIANKYTEDSYLTYEELKGKFLPAQMEAIWKEVMVYRELFVVEFPNQQYIVHSMALQKLHAQVERKLNRMIREQRDELEKDKEPSQYPVSVAVESYFKKKYYAIFSCSLKQICHDLLLEYSPAFAFLDETEMSTFVRLFYIMIQCSGEQRNLLLRHFSYELHAGHLLAWVVDDVVLANGFDQTKSYRTWLLRLNENLMDLYQSTRKFQDASYLRELQLVERYPELKSYQAEFFEHHREPDHYYTVEQFQLYCGTCYETARMGMEAFVRLGWYHKQKIGKKFVYFVG